MVQAMMIEPNVAQAEVERERKGSSAAVVIRLATLGLTLLVLNSAFLTRETFAQNEASDVSPVMLSLVRGV